MRSLSTKNRKCRESEKGWNESEAQRKRDRDRDRDVYFGTITALTEERRMRPLTSLHQGLILSLSTPGSNFTSTPCIPSSLPLSLQGSLSSLSRYFITSSPSLCCYLSLFHPSLPLFSPNLILFTVLNSLSSFSSTFYPFSSSCLALSFVHLPKLLAFSYVRLW